MKLFHYQFSGHSHRVRLMLSLLGAEYEPVALDLRRNEHKTPAYLELNPLGEVPTLVDEDSIVTDSTAALVYLAKKFRAAGWLPEDPLGAAVVQRWLSVASGELYRGPFTARAIKLLGFDASHETARVTADRLFMSMQAQLAKRDWLAAGNPTIADVAMYSYVRVADEGDLDIAPFTAIGGWLERVESLAGFEPMPRFSEV